MVNRIGFQGGGVLIATSLFLFLAVVWVPQDAMAKRLRTCYNFTWAGADNSSTCETRDPPCIPPLVLSNNTNPPNLASLEEYCLEYGCHITCTQDSSCIRWNWYDVSNKIINYSLFCGKVADATDSDTKLPKELDFGCWKQQVGINVKEVCVCNDKDKCNHASVLASPTMVLVTGMLLSWFVGRLWLH